MIVVVRQSRAAMSSGAATASIIESDRDDVLVVNPNRSAVAGRDQRGVVPYELRERLGQLLQPGVVRESAVPDGIVRAKNELDAAASA